MTAIFEATKVDETKSVWIEIDLPLLLHSRSLTGRTDVLPATAHQCSRWGQIV